MAKIYGANKNITKLLNSNVTTNVVMSDLTISGLTVGKWYHLTGSFRLILDAGANDDAINVEIRNGATQIAQATAQLGAPDSSIDDVLAPVNLKFQAISTTLTFTTSDASANSYVLGNGTTVQSYIQIEERSDLQPTTTF